RSGAAPMRSAPRVMNARRCRPNHQAPRAALAQPTGWPKSSKLHYPQMTGSGGYLQSGSAGLDANERQPAVRLPVGASPVQGCQPARPSWVLPYSPSTEDSRGARACAVNWRGRSAHGAYAIMYQATNTANANTITPAQYQPTNTSSLMLEDSSLLLGGIIHPFFAPARRDAGSLTARTWRRLGHRHRGAAYRADIAR